MSPLGRGSSFCVRREPATGWKVVPRGFQVSKGSINTHGVDRFEFRQLLVAPDKKYPVSGQPGERSLAEQPAALRNTLFPHPTSLGLPSSTALLDMGV